MHCDDVKRALYFFFDGSLGETRVYEIRTHLSLCPECESRSRVHSKLQTFFRKRLTPVAAPDHLKRRLQRSLRAFVAEWSS